MFLRVKEWGPSLSSGISSQDLSLALRKAPLWENDSELLGL